MRSILFIALLLAAGCGKAQSDPKDREIKFWQDQSNRESRDCTALTQDSNRLKFFLTLLRNRDNPNTPNMMTMDQGTFTASEKAQWNFVCSGMLRDDILALFKKQVDSQYMWSLNPDTLARFTIRYVGHAPDTLYLPYQPKGIYMYHPSTNPLNGNK